jgi:hypothetical protein
VKEKKEYTQSAVDEMMYDQYISGMAEIHRVFTTTLIEIKAAIENMQAIYDIGDVFGERKQKIAELQLAWDALSHLEDSFQGNYDNVLDSYKHGDWRDYLTSLNEEWPL